MNRLIVEWFWRTAMVCALGWIGWELHGIRQELLKPVGEDMTVIADTDDNQSCFDADRQSSSNPEWPAHSSEAGSPRPASL